MPGRGRFVALAIAAAGLAACGGVTGPGAELTTSTPPSPSTTSAPTSSSTTLTLPTSTTAPATTTTIDRPAAPTDPGTLADELVRAEQAVRDPVTPPNDVEHQAHVQQVSYRTLSLHPDWDATVLARVPPALVQTVQLNVAARREFHSMTTKIGDTVPAWRIVMPASESDLLAWYHDAQTQTGVGWQYLAAINLVEFGLGRIAGLSTAGAQGPMQFLPSTFAAYGAGGDITDPHDAILAAARMLAHNGFTAGNIDGALYSYNNDQHYVRGVEDYAAVLAADPSAFSGYYHWQVYYATTAGTVLLPVGYDEPAPVPATAYIVAHPGSAG